MSEPILVYFKIFLKSYTIIILQMISTILGVVFAFVWASFLPPVRRYNYSNDVIAELVVQNNNEQPTLLVSH